MAQDRSSVIVVGVDESKASVAALAFAMQEAVRRNGTVEAVTAWYFNNPFHLEGGPEYHRAGEHEHVHLVCSNCGVEDALSLQEARSLEHLIGRHHGFRPDLTHFAISGRCADCQ